MQRTQPRTHFYNRSGTIVGYVCQGRGYVEIVDAGRGRRKTTSLRYIERL
nr:MAG TPA: hypothetical protein [Caudoviricetes sp.]